MGGRIGYSAATGIMVILLSWLGVISVMVSLVPVVAISPILLYIAMLIGAQSFQETPKSHAPAIILALIPHLAAWGKLQIDGALHAAGTSVAAVGLDKLGQVGVLYQGLEVLAGGAILAGMILGAIAAFVIDREYVKAAGDHYPTTRVLTADGVVSLIGCLMGNPFINAVYIGHPGWKAMGGRIGYSAATGVMVIVLSWLGVILVTAIPFGIYDLVEAIDNVESAAVAGDSFPTTRVLTADGVVSLIGCLMGNPFINAVYIGHPGWKAMGGRIGYSAATLVPAACSAPSICSLPHAARCGTSARMIAGAWLFGVSWNDCAPISMAM